VNRIQFNFQLSIEGLFAWVLGRLVQPCVQSGAGADNPRDTSPEYNQRSARQLAYAPLVFKADGGDIFCSGL
jgi:hypothetical protein